MVNTLIDLKGLTRSIKALVYGIEWLIVDKFVDDEKTKNILRDLLCDRMSLIHEYAENKGSFFVRTVIAVLLFALFFIMDYRNEKFGTVDSQVVVNEVQKNLLSK